MSPFILLAIGLILIFIEFFIPGAVMGIVGSIIVLASIFIFISQTESAIAIVFFIIGAGACIALMIRFALWRIVHTKSSLSIYSDKDQENYIASAYDKALIGKKAIVWSDLKPGGYILVENEQVQAISLTGYISKGSEVIVVSGDGESLYVRSCPQRPLEFVNRL